MQPPPPDLGDGSLEFLEQELDRAKAELAEYQALISEIPSIYETKFRQQVHGLALEIRRLLEERRSLQEQLFAWGEAQPLAEALPQPAEARPVRKTPRLLRRWRLRRRRRWSVVTGRLLLHRRLPLLATGTVMAVSLLVVGVDALGRRARVSRGEQAPKPEHKAQARPQAKSATKPEAKPEGVTTRQAERLAVGKQQLRLRAAGPCWVEVRTLSGKVVLSELIPKGGQRNLDLGRGLRVRAGRPDLLGVALSGQDYRPLNAINNLGWNTFEATQAAALPSPPPPGT